MSDRMSDRKKTFNDDLDQEDYIKVSLVNQGVSIRRRKSCPLKNVPEEQINYKNLTLLNKYITELGKIIPSRISNVSSKKQRKLSQAIKRARNLALLSFVSKTEGKTEGSSVTTAN
jgi:small subunit ribosomal protein S18